jgi:uncharacterized protein (TIGR03083 family)
VSTYGDRWRAIFETATEAFVRVVDGIDPARLDGPGLDEWTLRDLVGHTSRALLTVELYLARESEMATLDGPVAYLAVAARASATEEGRAAITSRGRDAGVALAADVAGSVAGLARRVLELVDRTSDDAPCATPAGSIALADYLPTRALELTVHTLDISRALGQPAPDDLTEPVAACLDLVAAAIGATREAGAVLLALTGRGPLPSTLHVV